MKPNPSLLGLLLFAWLLIPHTPLSAALPNAWRITDNSSGTGASYSTNLPPAQQSAALSQGWRYTLHARLLDDFNDTATMVFLYGVGTNRFSVYLDLDNDDNITATPFNQSPVTLTDSGSGSTYYHTYDIVYNPVTRRAALLFDGIERMTWDGDDVVAANGLIMWGSGSSGGQGMMNFHTATFTIGTNVAAAAAYDAGTQGNPVTTPDPRGQGWAVSGASPSTTNFVSPDVVSLPSVLVPITLPAINVEPHEATIRGGVDLSGLAALAWFEWGTTTNYGTNSTPLFFLAKPGSISLSRNLAGLPAGTTFHFRCVATNLLGIAYGQDVEFTTPPTFEVTTLANSGAGSLRQAIADALSGDSVTFAITGKVVLTSELAVSKTLNIIGPGPLLIEVNGNDDSRVFSIFNGFNVTISGLTIKDGHAPDGGTGASGFDGGGIYNSGTLTLSNCVVTSNEGGKGGTGISDSDNGGGGGLGGDGGGIYNVGNLTLLACSVTHNTAGIGGIGGIGAAGVVFDPAGYRGGNGGSGGRGGGIFSSTAINSVGCDISFNHSGSGGSGGSGGDALNVSFANGGDGGWGGPAGTGAGVYVGGSAAFTDCQVEDNSTSFGGFGGNGGDGGAGGYNGVPGNPGQYGYGGGILNDATATFTGCDFTENGARWGGAIAANTGTLELNDCSLNENQADRDGGSLYVSNSLPTVVIRRSLFFDNEARVDFNTFEGGHGGGIFNDGNLRLENSTMVGNDADVQGGAIYNSASLTLINCTLVHNTAGGSGVGGLIGGGNLTNTILVQNTPVNLAGTITGINNRTSGDPQLAFLYDYGGSTWTMPPLPGSPVVDAGSDSVTNLVATDQRGYQRFCGAHIDIGAVEIQAANSNNPPLLTRTTRLGNGALQLNFTNDPAIAFSVYAATNVAAPSNEWVRLGFAIQSLPGQYQYTDTTTNFPQRFYKVIWP